MSRADIFKRKECEVTADSIVKDSVNAADALNNIYGKGRSNKTVSEKQNTKKNLKKQTKLYVMLKPRNNRRAEKNLKSR